MSTYGYLAHHGVKGMKWGIRRYQNENGTLTPEGMKRYGLGGSKVQGTLKERTKALNRAIKDIDSQRKADYNADVRAIKDTYKGKEKRQQLQKYNEYYTTGQKYAQKSTKELLSKKYGRDAYSKAEKEATAKAIGSLAAAAVTSFAIMGAAGALANKLGIS